MKVQEEKKKRENLSPSPGEPLREPRRPRTWPVQPPAQPPELLWPSLTPLSTVDLGEIRGMLLQILGRLDAIEKRLNKIEKMLTRQPL